MICLRCRRKSRRVTLVTMPLTGEQVPLCSSCAVPRLLAAMQKLVAHG